MSEGCQDMLMKTRLREEKEKEEVRKLLFGNTVSYNRWLSSLETGTVRALRSDGVCEEEEEEAEGLVLWVAVVSTETFESDLTLKMTLST